MDTTSSISKKIFNQIQFFLGVLGIFFGGIALGFFFSSPIYGFSNRLPLFLKSYPILLSVGIGSLGLSFLLMRKNFEHFLNSVPLFYFNSSIIAIFGFYLLGTGVYELFFKYQLVEHPLLKFIPSLFGACIIFTLLFLAHKSYWSKQKTQKEMTKISINK